ncbi:ATP synthase F1 subunit epsilon [Marinigracilibium pacificum]|uniref:ATP synthase F1 subunit epsilon n=1 Tax=Marinigracilibium pacificum TaxID=2729599 RepID=A0A848IZY2_9BACT|nr:ATP synthase F1 subunit epsilon [Marinigracilibium pacificum]NMM48698.1 ATP synthase F1 subunit epsilon [Marinigracilibium pacificum]
MYLEIVTPDKKIFEGAVLSATFPGSKGSFQVLNNHAPIISSLDKGTLSYVTKDNTNHEITVDGGVVEVASNRVVVLAEKVIQE